MRDYSKVSPKFWVGKTGRAIKELGIETRILALYFLTCPHSNMLGIYYLPIPYIVHDIGMDEHIIRNAMDKLIAIGFCSYDEQAEHIWVHAMARYQIAERLEEKDKRVKAVNDIFQSLPALSFLDDFFAEYKSSLHLLPRKKKVAKKLSTRNETAQQM